MMDQATRELYLKRFENGYDIPDTEYEAWKVINVAIKPIIMYTCIYTYYIHTHKYRIPMMVP